MAREESDREDLLREATALVERMEFLVPECDQPIVVGFRRGGSASVYVGAEPVFQFNGQNELRRAYWRGELLKAEGGLLVALSRQRTAAAVELVRRELDAAQCEALLGECREWLRRIELALVAGEAKMVGQVPADADVLGRVRDWLRGLAAEIRVAERPNVS